MCVHYAGNPADLDELRMLAKKYNLPLIEDSAHAMASEYKGNPIGSNSEIATFSFQCVKIVTCGDGGVITTINEDIYKRMKKLTWYGIDREEKKTDFLDPLPNDPEFIGYKSNMNDTHTCTQLFYDTLIL